MVCWQIVFSVQWNSNGGNNLVINTERNRTTTIKKVWHVYYCMNFHLCVCYRYYHYATDFFTFIAPVLLGKKQAFSPSVFCLCVCMRYSTCCSPPGICWLCSRLVGLVSPPTGGVWTCSCSLASGSCFTNSSFLSCSTTFFWEEKRGMKKHELRLNIVYCSSGSFVAEPDNLLCPHLGLHHLVLVQCSLLFINVSSQRLKETSSEVNSTIQFSYSNTNITSNQ